MKSEIICIENEWIRILVSPAGGKISSLFDKRKGREWLYQPESQESSVKSPVTRGDTFTRHHAYGCDEMFPTIIPEESLQGDGRVVNLPDHGELWSSDWELLSLDDDSVEMRFDSRILPCRFVRNLLISGNTLICRYTVINLSDADFPAIWTPHPLFSFLPETEIILPEECTSILQAGDGGALGPYLNRIEWGQDAEVPGIGSLLKPGSLKEGSAYKFYFSQALSEGRVGLRDSRGTMTMTYPAALLPWLGFWINKGGWGEQHNLAPEPATAPLDSPARSEAFGVPAVWKAAEIREWELLYRLD